MVALRTRKFIIRWNEKEIYNFVETKESCIAKQLLEKLSALGIEFTYSEEYVNEKIEGV